MPCAFLFSLSHSLEYIAVEPTPPIFFSVFSLCVTLVGYIFFFYPLDIKSVLYFFSFTIVSHFPKYLLFFFYTLSLTRYLYSCMISLCSVLHNSTLTIYYLIGIVCISLSYETIQSELNIDSNVQSTLCQLAYNNNNNWKLLKYVQTCNE